MLAVPDADLIKETFTTSPAPNVAELNAVETDVSAVFKFTLVTSSTAVPKFKSVFAILWNWSLQAVPIAALGLIITFTIFPA